MGAEFENGPLCNGQGPVGNLANDFVQQGFIPMHNFQMFKDINKSVLSVIHLPRSQSCSWRKCLAKAPKARILSLNSSKDTWILLVLKVQEMMDFRSSIYF